MSILGGPTQIVDQANHNADLYGKHVSMLTIQIYNELHKAALDDKMADEWVSFNVGLFDKEPQINNPGSGSERSNYLGSISVLIRPSDRNNSCITIRNALDAYAKTADIHKVMATLYIRPNQPYNYMSQHIADEINHNILERLQKEHPQYFQ